MMSSALRRSCVPATSPTSCGRRLPAQQPSSARLAGAPKRGRRYMRTWASAAATLLPADISTFSQQHANAQHLTAEYPAVAPLPPPPKSAELSQVGMLRACTSGGAACQPGPCSCRRRRPAAAAAAPGLSSRQDRAISCCRCQLPATSTRAPISPQVLPYLAKLALSEVQLAWRLGLAFCCMVISKSAGGRPAAAACPPTHPPPPQPRPLPPPTSLGWPAPCAA
jgi:hypothetical protein